MKIIYNIIISIFLLTNGKLAMAAQKISYHEAVEIANRELSKIERYDFAIDESRTQKKIFGWVFFYAPLKFLQTKDPKYAAPGNGPLVVNFDGTTQYLPTNRHSDISIKNYEEEFQRKNRN